MTLLWLDLETTGLDSQNDHILEVAWAPTHSSLLAGGEDITSLVVTPTAETFALLKANDFVTQMHTKSGLAEDLMDADNTISLIEAEAQILDHLAEFEAKHEDCKDDKRWYLAGASVHFDLAFINRRMPTLGSKLSHRVFDTSTLKPFMNMFMELPSELQPIGGLVEHRAADDLFWCLSATSFWTGQMVRAGEIMAQVETEIEIQGIISESNGDSDAHS